VSADSDRDESRPVTLSRRAAVKALGAVAVWPYLSDASAIAFAEIQSRQAPPKLAFLSSAQYATIDAVAEAIIPEDDHSPGARAARVADYIDLLLSESDETTRKSWLNGLALLDGESHKRFNRKVSELPPAQMTQLLTAISQNETEPKTPLDQFFIATKEATIRGYYTSEIGIQRELEYKGNRVIAEFTGCTHPEHGYQPGK
jgi:hypothetical protein